MPDRRAEGPVQRILRTQIAPLLRGDGATRRVLYLGDLDRSGLDIERNTLRVLLDACPDWCRAAKQGLDGDSARLWTRLALTREQTETLTDDAGHPLTPITKLDGRDNTISEAWELQALGQAGVVRLVRDALDGQLAPTTLADVHEREDTQRDELRAFLRTFDQ